MTRPPDFDTPFRRLATRLPSPLRENFAPRDWEEAFATIADPTPEDQRLFAAALWIGVKAQALYTSHADRFAGLGQADATVLAIAVLNHEYRVLTANARVAVAEASADADGPVTLDYVSNIRFENAHGQRMSTGDYVEAFIDALDAWLYDAARLPDTNEPPPDNVAALVPSLVHFYSMRHILKRLFDKVLHLGHYLDDDGVTAYLDFADDVDRRAIGNHMSHDIGTMHPLKRMSTPVDRRFHILEVDDRNAGQLAFQRSCHLSLNLFHRIRRFHQTVKWGFSVKCQDFSLKQIVSPNVETAPTSETGVRSASPSTMHSFPVILRTRPKAPPVSRSSLRSAGKNMQAAVAGPVDDKRSVIIISFDVEPCRLLTRHDRDVV